MKVPWLPHKFRKEFESFLPTPQGMYFTDDGMSEEEVARDKRAINDHISRMRTALKILFVDEAAGGN